MDGRAQYAEVHAGLMTDEQAESLASMTEDMSVIEHNKRPLLLGKQALLKVNTNIGVSDEAAFETEYQKLRTLAELPYRPDSMMDHTYVHLQKPLWNYMWDQSLSFYDASFYGDQGAVGDSAHMQEHSHHRKGRSAHFAGPGDQ